MRSHDEIFDTLGSPEVMARLKDIDKLDDPEEQGYQTGPIMAEATGLEPLELARHTMLSTSDSDSDIDQMRSLGVIRWCLEQTKEVTS